MKVEKIVVTKAQYKRNVRVVVIGSWEVIRVATNEDQQIIVQNIKFKIVMKATSNIKLNCILQFVV